MQLENITKEMPRFESHLEAKKWFKTKFPNNFRIRCSDHFSGEKIYFYHIVNNVELYQKYMKSFSMNPRPKITNMNTFDSYSTVEICENGQVKVYL